MIGHSPRSTGDEDGAGIMAAADQLPLAEPGSAASFAGRTRDLGEFRPVPALIEDMADRYRERTAVCYGGDSLTYAQLDRLANGIAIAAAGRGVAKGDRVAILLGNSLEQPASLPRADEARCRVRPHGPRLAGRAAADRAKSAVAAADLVRRTRRRPGEFRAASAPVAVDAIAACSRRPKAPLTPADLCYGLFTSGTTGTPKCALNRHGGLANRLRFMTRWFGATGDEVVLQNSKHTFDSSLWQLFWPLITGGRTVVPAPGEFLDLQQTIETIAEHHGSPPPTSCRASSMRSSPWSTATAGAQRQLSRCATWWSAARRSTRAPCTGCGSCCPRLAITNGYGPTETSIGMVFHLVPDADGDDDPDRQADRQLLRGGGRRPAATRCRRERSGRSPSAERASAPDTTATRPRPGGLRSQPVRGRSPATASISAATSGTSTSEAVSSSPAAWISRSRSAESG